MGKRLNQLETSHIKRISLDIYYLGLVLIIATLPFPIRTINYTIIFTILSWIGLMLFENNRIALVQALKTNTTAILFVTFALAFVASVLIHIDGYTEADRVLKTIEKRIPFLVFPIILSGIVLLQRIRIRRILTLFVWVMILTTLLCLFIGLIMTIKTGTVVHINSTFKSIIENNFMYHRLGSYIGIHAVFFSAYVLLAYCIVLIRFLWGTRKLNSRQKAFHVLVMLYLWIMIILLSSITIGVILPIVTIIIIAYYRWTAVRKIKWLMRITMISILILGTAIGGGTIKKLDVKKSLLEYNFEEYPGGDSNWNPLNVRLAMWEVAGAVIKDYWKWGVGTANMKGVMETYYWEYHFNFGLMDHFHPHNQFLHTFIVLGLGGIIILLFITFSVLRTSISRKDIVLGSLLVIFVLFSMTDSTLSVSKGIIFFTFFFTFLTYLERGSLYYLTGEDKN